MNYDFNIGTNQSLQPTVSLDVWWKYMVQNNIITAGFDGEAGDRGEQLLCNTLDDGDWIYAYGSEHGYIGVGLVESPYVLHNTTSPFNHLATHLHERKVKWLFYISDLSNAINAHSIGVPHPQQAMQRMDNDKVKKVIQAFMKNTNVIAA